MRNAIISAGLLCFGASCSGDTMDLTGDDEIHEYDTTAQVDVEPLVIGDTGDDIVAAHAFFMRYGYFENAALSAEYPDWIAIAGKPPADDSVFGAELERALLSFQSSYGLPVTGTLDAQTQELISKPRCGVPDSNLRSDLPGNGGNSLPLTTNEAVIDKWAPQIAPQFSIPFRSVHAVTYSVGTIPAGFINGTTGTTWVRATLEAALSTAFNRWRIRGTTVLSDLTFTKVASGASIPITFVSFPAGSTALAQADGSSLKFNVAFAFEETSTSGGFDLETVAAHEMGHSLGFGHSSVVNTAAAEAVMGAVTNVGEKNSALTPDDLQILAVSPYTNWAGVTGSIAEATDIGSSVVGGVEDTWMLGTGTNSEGFKIFRWNDLIGWQQFTGGGVRIDVRGDRPWVITNAGLAKRLDAGNNWVNQGDCNFKDIGASASVVWAVGGTPLGGDYPVYRYNGATGTACVVNGSGSWLSTGGFGKYIDVAPDGSPWVVQSDGSIYHLEGVTGAVPTGTTWTFYSGLAKDIAVGSDTFGNVGSVWITGNPGQSQAIYQLNIQPGVDFDGNGNNSGSSDSLPRNQWFAPANGGLATFITVGRDALPWVVTNNGSAYRRR